MSEYIDKAEFYALFQQRAAIEQRISAGLAKIAEGTSFKVKWPNDEAREDAVQAVTAELIAKIGKFDTNASDNAFAYFTTCARYAHLAQVKKLQLQRQRERSMETAAEPAN